MDIVSGEQACVLWPVCRRSMASLSRPLTSMGSPSASVRQKDIFHFFASGLPHMTSKREGAISWPLYSTRCEYGCRRFTGG